MLSGILFGLATLTRAILLAFPLGLALHLVLVDSWRSGLKRGLVFLVTYVLVVSTWTFYNLIRYDRLVIGAEGFAAFLYISAEGWEGPQAVDESLAEDAPGVAVDDIANDQRQDVYVEAASQSIRSDPLGYLRRRGTELVGGLAQPHGTAFFPGESLKDAMSNWLEGDRTMGSLVALVGAEAFWPKLTLYVLHFVGLIMGLVGMWLTRRRWRLTLPLIGFIGYTLLVALVTLALPRYLFPMELFWWVFASVVISRQWSVISQRQPVNRPTLKTEN